MPDKRRKASISIQLMRAGPKPVLCRRLASRQKARHR
jgi:hypothetical protein